MQQVAQAYDEVLPRFVAQSQQTGVRQACYTVDLAELQQCCQLALVFRRVVGELIYQIIDMLGIFVERAEGGFILRVAEQSLGHGSGIGIVLTAVLAQSLPLAPRGLGEPVAGVNLCRCEFAAVGVERELLIVIGCCRKGESQTEQQGGEWWFHDGAVR